MFTHFYSDPHYGHRNISKYACRPFVSVHQMNEELITRYNDTVGENDFCLWFGDAYFMPKEAAKTMLGRLNGRKAIIKGNHDKHSGRWFLGIGFSYVFEGPIHLTIAGRAARASHYPYITTIKDMPHHKYRDRYPMPIKGEILLHGHIHKSYKMYENQIHVGVDAWDYRPVSVKQIEDLINQNLVEV